MKHTLRTLVGTSLALLALGATSRAISAPLTKPAARAPFTVDDLVRLRRLSDPQVSPDGRYVAFQLRETDMQANKGRNHVWLVDLKQPDSAPRQLTNGDNDTSPRWSADGRFIYFISTRSGSAQVWRLPLSLGEAMQVTRYPLDVGTLSMSPQGDRLAVTMEVFAECRDLSCSRERLDKAAKSKSTGQVYDRIFVRHWDTWGNGTRSHLFTAALTPDGTAGPAVDVSAPLDADVPSKPDGDSADYAFSPDGRRIVFTARVAGTTEPLSTNFDLYESPVDGSATPEILTAANPAWDARPVFLPNGDLAYVAMDRPGFESDRFHVVIRSSRDGASRPLALDWDRSVTSLAALPDGRLLAAVDDLGQHALYAIDTRTGKPTRLVANGQVTDFAVGGKQIVFGQAALAAPVDLYAIDLRGGTPRRLTDVNAELLRSRTLGDYEQFSFSGANGEKVHGYVVKPFGFKPGNKYPIAFIVHGGPQVSFSNGWNYRWNPQVFAGAGYGVVFIDFHGSPGYGQKFTDSISGDWGGKPLEDLKAGLAAALDKYPWLDGTRACSLGPSYGGFMQNWIAGQWPDRFRCLVNHAGIFDQRLMSYSTEELWFQDWEFGGPYYDKPENYEKFNPANFVRNWKTPALITLGALDYRVPYSQGLGAFTVLQRRGIESRLLYFADEGHWILKPANSVQWYQTVIGWLDSHLK
jgi:dipeptidyl aminopeptidase/acylaminoacyl peptidase